MLQFNFFKELDLGSKNKKLLGLITAIIIHNIRNIFNSKELYITKRKLALIETKHPNEFFYIKEPLADYKKQPVI